MAPFRLINFPKIYPIFILMRRESLTQVRAARRFGVSQPRISDLKRGLIDRFTIDALVNMLASAGLRVEITLPCIA